MNTKVDILIVTYNQQDFIAKAIESILEQKVNFTYRINIADDFSSDKTREIILRYKEKYPDVINLILAEKNHSAKKNFINGTKYLLADYIACLDGDDYWCNNLKLQKQIDFLDNNPDFVACAHNTLMLDDIRDNVQAKIRRKIDDVFTIQDFLDGSASFHSSSFVFRNVFHGNIPKLQEHEKSEDLFFAILHAKYGKVKYIDEIMSVYRMHGKGEWTSLNEESQLQKAVVLMQHIHDVFGEEFSQYSKYGLKKSIKNLYRKSILPKKQSKISFALNYIKYRAICYSIKFYEIKKKICKKIKKLR